MFACCCLALLAANFKLAPQPTDCCLIGALQARRVAFPAASCVAVLRRRPHLGFCDALRRAVHRPAVLQ